MRPTRWTLLILLAAFALAAPLALADDDAHNDWVQTHESVRIEINGGDRVVEHAIVIGVGELDPRLKGGDTPRLAFIDQSVGVCEGEHCTRSVPFGVVTSLDPVAPGR